MSQGGLLNAGLQYLIVETEWSASGGGGGQLRKQTLVASFRNVTDFNKAEGCRRARPAGATHAVGQRPFTTRSLDLPPLYSGMCISDTLRILPTSLDLSSSNLN